MSSIVGGWRKCSLLTQMAAAGAPLLLGDEAEAFSHVAFWKRREPEPGAPGLQRRDDLADVVADQAEARIASVLLDYCGLQRLGSQHLTEMIQVPTQMARTT